jgi:hypothetical protein
MQVSKKYLHDRFVLLLVSVNLFLAFLCIVLVVLRLSTGQGSGGYIVQYRSNVGISVFKTGSVSGLVSFVVFALLIVITNIVLSVRTYHVRRELALVVLSLGALLLTFAIIISNALLVLR